MSSKKTVHAFLATVRKVFLSDHPCHPGRLDGLLSAAAAMQEEMGQDRSEGSLSPLLAR